MMITSVPSLAMSLQPAGRGGVPTQPIVMWTIVLIGLVMLGGLLVMLFRRQLLAKDAGQPDHGSVMESIRAMRDAGQISNAEYEAMKRRMVDAIRHGSTPFTGAPPPAPPGIATRAPAPTLPAPGPKNQRVAKPGFDLTGAPLPRPPRQPPPG